ncbi:MAG: HD domain-containing protein [Clostridia bacterium]|jgi:uncharacterized protein|nr:HD domain-containing protein [Clostridiaceae bacterium]HJJ13469.1 HD domain-containing protein [Clostridiaceae bacterium]
MKESLTKDIEEFNMIIYDLANHPTVQKMKLYRQHYDTNCFDHCYNVAFYSYLICKKLNLDYISVSRAGMLHDLFLYDWRKKQPEHKRFHGFRHPRIALNNASKLFDLNEKEKDIILKHMWPITIIPPKYIEGYIITLTDKYCALEESYNHYFNYFKKRKLFRYAYIFLCLVFFRIV